MDHHKKPGSPGDILKHHGVKGMKWGVRKEEEAEPQTTSKTQVAQRNDTTKAYMAAASELAKQPRTKEQAEAAFTKNREKATAKFAPSEKEEPGKSLKDRWNDLSDTQKSAIAYGVMGTAIVGYGLYSHHQYTSALNNPGALIKPNLYGILLGKSQQATWMGQGFIRDSSLARPAFELPAGHVFHRISTAAENGFGGHTYATASLDDFNRYAVGFDMSGGTLRPGGATGELHHIIFQSKSPVKVPALTEVLETMRSVIGEERKAGIDSVTHKTAVDAYNGISGSWWDEPRATNLISKLQAKGYGGLVDEMDAGVRADKPLLLFGENFSPKVATPILKTDIKTAKKNLREIAQRKL